MKKGLKTAIVIALTAVLVIGLIWIVHYTTDLKKSREAMEKVQEAAKPEPEADSEQSNALVDLSTVQGQNPDVVAWLRWTGEGSVIDYPVLQSTPDEGEDYYLRRDLSGEHATAGCIYMQQVDAADFSDYMTVLYGHNMHDGTMFKGLHQFDDQAFFDTETNRTFLVQTADKVLTYKAYAAVKFSDKLLPAVYDDSVPEARIQFLSDLASSRDMTSHIDSSMNITNEDHLLVLSTCVNGDEDARYLVVCVLQSEEPLT